MRRYLRIEASDMQYLKRRAIELDMIFKSPNAVIRDILALPEKSRKPPTQMKGITKGETGREVWKQPEARPRQSPQINLDDEVFEQLNAKARELNIKVNKITRLLEAISRSVDEKDEEDKPLTRATRPPTRRG